MRIQAIVPIKPLNRAKSRLSAVLSPAERERLAVGLLRHNLEVLSSVSAIEGVLVISRDASVLALAREYPRVQTLQESGTPELNHALRYASRMLLAWGVDASLILPADLPLTHQEDIETMLDLGHNRNTIVIAPDFVGDGTNAMLCHPPDVIPFGFGVGSYGRHRQTAQSSGVEVCIYSSERLALDIDTPHDLNDYQRLAEKYGEKMIDYRDPIKV